MAIWRVYGGARTMTYATKQEAKRRADKLIGQGQAVSIIYMCRKGVFPRTVFEWTGWCSRQTAQADKSEDPYE